MSTTDRQARWIYLLETEPRLAELVNEAERIGKAPDAWWVYEGFKVKLKRILLDSQVEFEAAYTMTLNRIAGALGL